MKLFALHGFLGSPNDWTILKQAPGGAQELNAVDLLDDMPIVPLEQWGASFNRAVRERNFPQAENLLIGYSLGGRLALHALIDDPGLWRAAVIVSAHPGLAGAEERTGRVASDEVWASRMEGEAWEQWIDDWNSQEVFRNDPTNRGEPMARGRRVRSAEALRTWSLGRQSDLAGRLSALEIPILWIVGENDKKFVGQANRLKFKHPASEVVAIKGAGHRVPWGQTTQFLSALAQFINYLEERT
jgi:2-succinyl-6-hydroxy-2,4-cyclohexadiene-1-carboxylate synthase